MIAYRRDTANLRAWAAAGALVALASAVTIVIVGLDDPHGSELGWAAMVQVAAYVWLARRTNPVA